jgi:predicted acylesterase/phospholipase RssA
VKAYAIFEGGGAKGYAHIGAFKASEERGISISAVAGTSIGAVIACLISAGYKADELFSIGANGERTGLLALDPLDKLDKKDWKRFESLANAFAPSSASKRGISNWISDAMKIRSAMWRTYVGLFLIWAFTPLAFRKHRHLMQSLFRHLGFTTTSGFREFLDQALRAKLNVPGDRPVRFSDLSIPLKVIAADLVSEEIVVFPRSQDDCVAEAVVASASFPIFFRPTLLEDLVLVDGGILSNRPAWVFDQERKASVEVTQTFCFLLVDQPIVAGEAKKNSRPRSILEFVFKLARTTISGRKHLETRGIPDLYSVEVAASTGALSLREAFQNAPLLVEQGRRDATLFFSKLIGPRDPATMKRALELLSASVYQVLNEGVGPGDIRCSILVQGDDSARLSYASYQPSADYGVFVNMDSPGPAASFRLRQPVLTLIDAIPPEARENPVNKYEHALRAREVRLVYSVPVFANGDDWEKTEATERSNPIAVLCISATEDVGELLRLPEVEDTLASFAQLLSIGLLPTANWNWLRNPEPIPDSAHEAAAEWLRLDESLAFLLSSRIERRVSARDGIDRLLDQLGPQFNAHSPSATT